MVGPRSTSWKGGISFRTERGRLNIELRRWKKAVIERDGGRCRKCGATDDIHAHHVKPWADFPKLRFALSNGIAICVDCHSRVHGRKLGGGWKARRQATG
jgi:5-methylcytosine-specific restriction endonuclease McrA